MSPHQRERCVGIPAWRRCRARACACARSGGLAVGRCGRAGSDRRIVVAFSDTGVRALECAASRRRHHDDARAHGRRSVRHALAHRSVSRHAEPRPDSEPSTSAASGRRRRTIAYASSCARMSTATPARLQRSRHGNPERDQPPEDLAARHPLHRHARCVQIAPGDQPRHGDTDATNERRRAAISPGISSGGKCDVPEIR